MKKLFTAIAILLGLVTFASATNLDDAVSWMHTNGLTIYNNATDFHADRGLRRDEAAKFFVQFATLLGKTGYVKTATQCTFSDINQSWSDLKDTVVQSCRMGLFQGAKGKFNPQNQLTNAQSITVLVRLLAGFQSENGVSHRADNYYSKANELGLLKNVSMNSKDATATRGDVGIIIYDGNTIKNEKQSNTTTYSSLLGYSLDLPGECSDGMVNQEGQPTQYLQLQNLNITNTNGDKEIQCFIPSISNSTQIVHITIQNYPCDMTGQLVTIGGNTFELTTTLPGLGADNGKRCYKANINNQSIYFTFTENQYTNDILSSLIVN